MLELLNNGNQISIEGLVGLAKNIVETNMNQQAESKFESVEEELLEEIETSPKKVSRYGYVEGDPMYELERIIEGVARKYAVQNYGVDQEDLEQELWIVAVEKFLNKVDDPSEINFRLFARCCWNRAVDIYRYSRRRHDSKSAYEEGSKSSDDSDPTKSTDDVDYQQSSPRRFSKANDVAFIKEAIDLFPKGSRERKYVVTKLYMYGEVDETMVDPSELELPEGDTEVDVVHMLGYKSHDPASWRKKKNQIRKDIYKFIGRLDADKAMKNDLKRAEAIARRCEEILFSSKSRRLSSKEVLKDRALWILGATKDDLLDISLDSDRVCGIQEGKEVYVVRQHDLDIAL